MQKTTPSELSQQERAKITDFLDSHPVAVIATVDENGDPNASPIYFAVSSDLTIAFTTKRDTNKHNNITRHSQVMLAVYDAESQTSVQLSGQAIEETNPENAQTIYHGTLQAAKQTSEDNVPPIAKIAAGSYVAYTVSPDNIWMSEYSRDDSYTNALSHIADTNSLNDPA
jgi:general stress protein 26